MNSRRKRVLNDSLNFPWYKNNVFYGLNTVGLDKEIKHFYDYMAPTQLERRIRADLSQRIENIIVSKWPDSQVHLYGSFRTGLYLSTSDINITVMGKWKFLPFDTLEEELISKGLTDICCSKELDDVTKSRLIVTDKETKLHVDIAFNNWNGIKSTELIEHYIREYPTLPKLVYVLKQYLIVKEVYGTFMGAISGYGLTLMCISLLQLHFPPAEEMRNANLGILLMEFFELYGEIFNYRQIAIRIKNGGSYIYKEKLQKFMENDSERSLLCIEDPILPTNDVGRNSYRIVSAKTSFELAFTILTNAVDPYSMCELINRPTILGRILYVPHKVAAHRHWIEQQFSQLLSPSLGSVSLQPSETAGTSRSPQSRFNSGSTSKADNAATSEEANPPSPSISSNNVQPASQESQPPK